MGVSCDGSILSCGQPRKRLSTAYEPCSNSSCSRYTAVMSWLDETTLPEGHQRALVRARRVADVRARAATFRRLGIQLPDELVAELEATEAAQAPEPLPSADA